MMKKGARNDLEKGTRNSNDELRTQNILHLMMNNNNIRKSKAKIFL